MLNRALPSISAHSSRSLWLAAISFLFAAYCTFHTQKAVETEAKYAVLLPQWYVSLFLSSEISSFWHADIPRVCIKQEKYKLFYSPQTVTKKPTIVLVWSPTLFHDVPKQNIAVMTSVIFPLPGTKHYTFHPASTRFQEHTFLRLVHWSQWTVSCCSWSPQLHREASSSCWSVTVRILLYSYLLTLNEKKWEMGLNKLYSKHQNQAKYIDINTQL